MLSLYQHFYILSILFGIGLGIKPLLLNTPFMVLAFPGEYLPVPAVYSHDLNLDIIVIVIAPVEADA